MISTVGTVLCPLVTDTPPNRPPDAPTHPPGWFPDPLGRHEHRYFNGSSWTADVADAGERFVDPYGAQPRPLGFDAPQSPRPTGRNGVATAAMVCGLLAVLLAWIPFVVVAGLILAVLGVLFGINGLRKSAQVGSGRGSAITGIVTGVIGLALSVLGIALSVLVFRAVEAFIEPGAVTTEVTSCSVDAGIGSVRGELTNRSRDTRDYSVFVTVGERTEVFTLDDVASGETVEWATAVSVPGATGRCEAEVVVQGPFPFGIELDPVEG